MVDLLTLALQICLDWGWKYFRDFFTWWGRLVRRVQQILLRRIQHRSSSLAPEILHQLAAFREYARINYVENSVTSEKCYLPNILLAVARIEVRQKLDPILWCFIASWSHIRQFAAIFNRTSKSSILSQIQPGAVRLSWPGQEGSSSCFASRSWCKSQQIASPRPQSAWCGPWSSSPGGKRGWIVCIVKIMKVKQGR